MVKDLQIEDFRDGDIIGLGKNGRCFKITESEGDLIAKDKDGHGDTLKNILTGCEKNLNNIYNRIGLFGNSNEYPDLLYDFNFEVKEEESPLEFIICSSIWFDDEKRHLNQPKNIKSGYVISGRRHHDCFKTLEIISRRNHDLLNQEKEQGFLTNENRFVDREEAASIAYKYNQISEEKDRLHSEDLY